MIIRKSLALVLLCVSLPACAAQHGTDLAPAAIPAQSQLPKNALGLYGEARLRAADGDLEGALVPLNRALEQDPNAPYLHTALAQLYLQLGRNEEALAECQKAVKLDPNSASTQLMAANILVSLQRVKEAVPHLQKVIELDPTKEEVYLHLAVYYLKNFEYEQAVNTLKSLVKAVPDSPLGYYYLAKCYDQMKLPKEALSYYKKAVEIKPDFEQALIEMGISQETQGLTDDAIQTYRTLLQTNPGNVNVVQHLAQLYIQQRKLKEALDLLQESGGTSVENSRKIGLLLLELERYDEAVSTFEDILKQEPEAHQVRFYLATAYEEKEDTESAIEEFSKIPSDSSYYSDALGHLAYLYKEEGAPDKGVKLLKDEIARNPAKVEPYLHLAGLYESMERYQAGVDVLTSMDKTLAADPRVNFRLGVLYDKMGKKDLSVAMMRKVIAASPDDAQALNYLGYTFAEMGTNLDEALGYLKKAVTLRPDDGFILDSLGWVYFKMKRYDEAIYQLEQAAQLSDDDTTVMGHLADAYCAGRHYKKGLSLFKKLQQKDPEGVDLADRMKRCRPETGEK